MSEVSIAINGSTYGGWKGAQVRRSLKALSGSFSLSVTDRWSEQRIPWLIKPGDACEVFVDGQQLITGFVDSVAPSFTASEHSIEVSGRDKTADLVDCSVDIGTFELKNVKLEELASKLAKQFGLSVIFSGDSGSRIENAKINIGETGFEILEKYCRQKGFLLTTDGKGSIVITRPGTDRASTALEQGKNILSASAEFNFTERFSDYRVVTQYGGLAVELGTAAFSIVGRAKDEFIKRKRSLLLSSENSLTSNDAQKRAEWEATVRAARSGKFKVSVQEWKQQDGKLWAPNQLVRVKSSHLGLDGDLMITSVGFIKGDEGTITELELERADAYTPEPVVKEKIDPFFQQVAKARGQ